MLGAIVKNNIVENVIVLNSEQKEELEKALQCEIIDARPHGLAIGDLRTPRGWTRNAGGEQMLLEEQTPESYDSYIIAMHRASQAEEQAQVAGEQAVAEVNSVLLGRVEDENKPIAMMARVALDNFIVSVADNTEEINEYVDFVREWVPANYSIGDVRKYNDIPYKCVQAHDSTSNETWTPDTTPALWIQYHGTTYDTAREWVQPTGAHDQYLAGEYVIFDKVIYRCLFNTVYSPTDYAYAWEKVE